MVVGSGPVFYHLPLVLGVTLSPFDVATLDSQCLVSSDILLFLVELSFHRTPREVREKVFLVNPFAWTKWCRSRQEKNNVSESMVDWRSEAARAGKAQYAACICLESQHFYVLAVSIAQTEDGVVVLDSNHDSLVPSNMHNNAVESFRKLLIHVFPAVSHISERIVMPEQYPQQAYLDCSMHCAMAIDALFKHAAAKSSISLKKLPFRSPPAGWRSVVQGFLNDVQKVNMAPAKESLAYVDIHNALFSSNYTQQ